MTSIISLVCFFPQKYVFIGLYEKMEQVPKLVQWLISIGASVETIGPYPLHALMRLCIQASKSSPCFPPSKLPFQPSSGTLLSSSETRIKPLECRPFEYSNDLVIQMNEAAGKSYHFYLSWHLVAAGGPNRKDSVFLDRSWQEGGALVPKEGT